MAASRRSPEWRSRRKSYVAESSSSSRRRESDWCYAPPSTTARSRAGTRPSDVLLCASAPSDSPSSRVRCAGRTRCFTTVRLFRSRYRVCSAHRTSFHRDARVCIDRRLHAFMCRAAPIAARRHSYTSRGIVPGMRLDEQILGDFKRAAASRSGPLNLGAATIRWCDDLGFDVGECLHLAVETQRSFVQSGRPW